MFDEEFRTLKWIVGFWATIILLNIWLAPWMSQAVSGDFSELAPVSNSYIADAFINLFKIMTFQISSPTLIFISIFLDVLAFISAYVVYSAITGR